MEDKLNSSIQSNSYKIVELYNKLDSGALTTSPDFQRKKIWKKQHKYAFIKTILQNYPFPEVYIASSSLDVENLRALEVVVDGQQRLSTILDYIKGTGDFAKQSKIIPFQDLEINEKREFLNYPVSVKDLKDIGQDRIIEIFKRINSTDYALNANEILNAEYGDGEFAYFAKQLVDLEFEVTDENTDVIIDHGKKTLVQNFFNENLVFSENDKKRMFDSQYIMLIAATLLEGSYFSRSTKIAEYLRKYNLEYESYNIILDKIINSISIIEKLNFNKDSYWFNKANLFTLIIELANIKIDQLEFDVFESHLLELEKKSDIFFTADDEIDIEFISDDERKYFGDARHGSHELAARIHRGKVIRKIIIDSGKVVVEKQNQEGFNEVNKKVLEEHLISYALIIPTETGLKKNIMDAVSNVRAFLKESNLHNYEIQELGPDHKVVIDGFFIKSDEKIPTKISLYKSNGRGDCRIWFSSLSDFANANDELALIVLGGIPVVLNLNFYDYSKEVQNFSSELKIKIGDT